MTYHFTLNNIKIEVKRKNIKNMYLSVSSKNGNVCISAPIHLKDEYIKKFALKKLDWIYSTKTKINSSLTLNNDIQENKIYLWGNLIHLNITKQNKKSYFIFNDDKLDVYLNSKSSINKIKQLINNFYLTQIKQEINNRLAYYENKIGVKTNKVIYQSMKTKWGFCNTYTKIVKLNLELVKIEKKFLEYVLVHELIHLIESNHGQRFKKLINIYSPNWKILNKELKFRLIREK